MVSSSISRSASRSGSAEVDGGKSWSLVVEVFWVECGWVDGSAISMVCEERN